MRPRSVVFEWRKDGERQFRGHKLRVAKVKMPKGDRP